MRALLSTAMLALGSTAQAEMITFTCQYTSMCRASGCEPFDHQLVYLFDTEAGTGTMTDSDGYSYEGTYVQSDGFHHYFDIEESGSDVASISDEGRADHVAYRPPSDGGDMDMFRTDGQCARE